MLILLNTMENFAFFCFFVVVVVVVVFFEVGDSLDLMVQPNKQLGLLQ